MSSLQEEPDDIAADLRAAFAEASPEPVREPKEAKEAPEPESRARDEHGRFAPKEETVDKTAAPQQTANVVETPLQEPEKAILPPVTWTATAKAKFATLDPEVQQEVLRREKEMQAGLDQWAPKGEVFNKFEQLMQPHRDRLTLNGLDPFQYLQALVHADEMLRTNPAQAFPQIAQMYGYQLPGAPQDQQQPPVNPELMEVRQQLAQMRQALESRDAAQEEAQTQAARDEIEAFRQDPAHMYFENVRKRMVALMKAGEAVDLEDAYDQACHADKTIRGLLSGVVAKPAPGQAKGDQVKGSPGNASATPKVNANSSIADDIRAAWDEHTGRV